jgi:hypothetical protein
VVTYLLLRMRMVGHASDKHEIKKWCMRHLAIQITPSAAYPTSSNIRRM